MRRRKTVIALAAAGLFGALVAPASAELRLFSVTLITGETITVTMDVAPDFSLETLMIPGLPAPMESIVDLGPVATPMPEPTAVPAPPSPTTGGEVPQATAPSFLQPFPVVRIRGTLAAGGANVTLLRVRAPASATVTVACAGDGCPIRRQTRKAGRLRAFERFLPAGMRITIRVRRPGYIGKYVRITIRDAKPPARHDACLLPGSRRPATCPQP